MSAAPLLSKISTTHVALGYALARVPSRQSCHQRHGDDCLREVVFDFFEERGH
ncbi:MAG: hypothetical protein HYY44_08650 [Deltaproteobacteria bacterium]|nr:hypothetical protein [Deltaproteobacteria bacterium]